MKVYVKFLKIAQETRETKTKKNRNSPSLANFFLYLHSPTARENTMLLVK